MCFKSFTSKAISSRERKPQPYESSTTIKQSCPQSATIQPKWQLPLYKQQEKSLMVANQFCSFNKRSQTSHMIDVTKMKAAEDETLKTKVWSEKM